jgi:class 3 adenylate cyclase
MTAAPETRYTRSADGTNLAYQVSGDGPYDLVWLGVGMPVDLMWEAPGFLRIAKRLSRFSRCIWLNPVRGWDGSEGDPRESLDLKVSDADIVAVLDAAAVEKAALVGWSTNAGGVIHFSATHPQRVSALVVIDGCAHYVREPDYPWGYPRETLDKFAQSLKADWSTAGDLEATAPHLTADEGFRAWWSRARRVTYGPDSYVTGWRAHLDRDLRPFLPSVSCPTLVLHRQGDRFIHLGAGRYVAEHIARAKFIVLPGDDHLFYVGDTDALVDEIEEFLTGVRSGAEGDVLTMTVLFTDIVASTERQARLGQREWSRLTDRHDAMVRTALGRHRGHEVKTTGDGFLATFDATGRALRCAAEIVAGAKDIGLELRAGVHTGEVEVRGDDIAGLAVTIAKRVCDLAGPGEVLASHAVEAAVAGSGIEFGDRGEQRLKGVPGKWRLYAVSMTRT